MRHYFFIAMIAIVITISFFACDNNESKNLHESNKAREIPGTELITDKQFRSELLEYLSLNEKLDYFNKYSYLSEGYLKKHFPHVKNAAEYYSAMYDSESGPPKYLEITEWRQSKKNEYEVELIFETNAEGRMVKIKALYYFVNENGKWKFDDWESLNYEYQDEEKENRRR